MGFRAARIKANKKAVEVAAYMGVTRIAVYQWESGSFKPEADKLLKLAEFYGCGVEDLLKDNPNQRSVQKNGQ